MKKKVDKNGGIYPKDINPKSLNEIFRVFPTVNAKVIGLHPRFQKLADLSISLQWLKETIPHRILPSPERATPVWLNYHNYTLFEELCFDVCQEFSINESNGLTTKDKIRYNATKDVLKECIELMDNNSEIMTADMTCLLGLDKEFARYYPDNWYKLIYDQLVTVNDVIRPEITHRMRALAYLLKVEAKEAEAIPITKQKPAKYKQAIYSLNEASVTYRSPTAEELTEVIRILSEDGFVEAQKLAESKLKKIVPPVF